MTAECAAGMRQAGQSVRVYSRMAELMENLRTKEKIVIVQMTSWN